MANSIRARLMGVALGALAVACGSCAAPISNDAKLHLAAAPEDFRALSPLLETSINPPRGPPQKVHGKARKEPDKSHI